ncbi:MAG: hypothetical protein PVF77_07820, partial [Anaerolineae bacterium]
MFGRKLFLVGLAGLTGLLLVACDAAPAEPMREELAPIPALQSTPTLLPAPEATVTTGTGGLP